eukprot:NODE_291_length_10603_cov_1.029703.p7 type:complete len:196 gc:universal NODE_291_length_10603_cov_1.029703:7084-7671(+)
MEQIKLGPVHVKICIESDYIEIHDLPGDTTKQLLQEILKDLLKIEKIVLYHPHFELYKTFPIFEDQDLPVTFFGAIAKIYYSHLHPEFMTLLKQRKWITKMQPTYYVDIDQAEKEATELLEFFDIETNEEEVDDDGFTMVKSKHRAPVNKRTYEKSDFYRFQMKESKKRKLDELQEKFAEDKLKIAKMKRVFKGK